jgi:hypothetical protein
MEKHTHSSYLSEEANNLISMLCFAELMKAMMDGFASATAAAPYGTRRLPATSGSRMLRLAWRQGLSTNDAEAA